MLIKRSPTQKSTYSLFSFIWYSRIGKTNLWWKKIEIVVRGDVRELSGVMIMFSILIEIYRCMHLSKTQYTCKIYAFFCIWILPQKKNVNKYWTSVNAMYAVIFKGKGTDLCNIWIYILWNAWKDKMEGRMGRYVIK